MKFWKIVSGMWVIMKLSKAEAIKEVLKSSKIENKIRAIESVSDNGLFDLR